MIFESEKDDAFPFTPLAGFHHSQIFQIKTLLNQAHFASELQNLKPDNCTRRNKYGIKSIAL